MKALELFQYPVLTKNLLVKLGHTPDELKFQYADQDGNHDLEQESEAGATSNTTYVKVTDPDSIWHPDTNNLFIEVSGEIQRPVFLFGHGGLFPKTGSIAGIAAIWADKEARIRGTVPIGRIQSGSTGPAAYSGELVFPAGTLRGLLTIRIVLYVIQSSGKGEDGEEYASLEGTVLGVIDEKRIVIEGSGAVFPVVEEEAPGQPLWWIDASIQDPSEDMFDEEHFALILNKAHPAYPDLHTGDDQYSPLMTEVIAGTMFTLILLVQQALDKVKIFDESLPEQPGSVLSTVRHMSDLYGWKNSLDNPAELNRAIHQTLEKQG